MADSVESFVLSYTTLLTSAPGITPTLLANLINARATSDKHMTKADAREVSGQARLGQGAAAGSGTEQPNC